MSVVVRAEGGSETAGGGTISYGGSSNIVYYAPTQAETNYTAFVVVAYKTGCIPVSQTVVTSASATAGYAGVDWGVLTNKTTTNALTGTTIATTQQVDVNTIKTQTVNCSAGVTVSPFVGSTGAAVNGTNANTLSSHDPGTTLGTSTLTQTQVTGGAYALNSASFAFNAALDFTTTQKAATIATVTNLTNAPTNGDLTATMKTSVTTAATAATPTAAAVTGAVGSVTGNVGGNVNGNVSGSVGSVLGGIDTTSGTTKTLDALLAALNSAHGAGSWATATGFATSGALATAQSDLDILTGADGATLATAQPNYAPAVAGAQMDLVDAPNATAIAAIKTGLGTIDVNVTKVTGTAITGSGTSGDPWGP